jgi:hypothetical protein
LSRRVSRAKLHGDQMSNEPIDELQIPQPCRCARCAVSREFLKKSVDVIRSERRQSLATGEKESIEARKHRTVLNDGTFGESSAVGASGFGALPLRICCFGIARPECQRHNRYTELAISSGYAKLALRQTKLPTKVRGQ